MHRELAYGIFCQDSGVVRANGSNSQGVRGGRAVRGGAGHPTIYTLNYEPYTLYPTPSTLNTKP